MSILIIILLGLAFPAQAVKLANFCANLECAKCVSAEECSFALDFQGKWNCVNEEDVEKLPIRKILYGESECLKYFKGNILKRSFLKPTPQLDKSVQQKQIRSAPQSPLATTPSYGNEIKSPVVTPKNAKLIPRNCSNNTRNGKEKLFKTLCRLDELLRKGTSLDRDLLIMKMLNPMRVDSFECKQMKMRKSNCTNIG